METAPSSEIRTERARLAAAREALRRMRKDVLTTETALGDAVVDKYTNAVLRRSRERRAELLTDLPDVPLFFGRLAYPRGRLFDDGEGGLRDGNRPDSPTWATSAAATCTTPPAPRWCWTGARPSRPPSTGPGRATRWAC
ncbi:hypothetical protein ACFQXA_34910 [Nocardiopsis composta]